MIDARPDFSVQSSDFRMEVSFGAVMNHINNFMHPQAILVDGSETEEMMFLKIVREKTSALGRVLIELPANPEQSLTWITRLDSASLSGMWQSSVHIHAKLTNKLGTKSTSTS